MAQSVSIEFEHAVVHLVGFVDVDGLHHDEQTVTIPMSMPSAFRRTDSKRNGPGRGLRTL